MPKALRICIDVNNVVYGAPDLTDDVMKKLRKIRSDKLAEPVKPRSAALAKGWIAITREGELVLITKQSITPSWFLVNADIQYSSCSLRLISFYGS